MSINMVAYYTKSSILALFRGATNIFLPLLFSLPFLFFVYLKTTYPSPSANCYFEQSSCYWKGLPIDYISSEWMAIISSVLFVGAVGSTISFFARHNDSSSKFWKARTVIGTQLVGAIFSTILFFAFLGGLVQGSIFPQINGNSWQELFFRVPEWGKLIVWSFIAGFFERFVPDLLKGFIVKSSSKDQ